MCRAVLYLGKKTKMHPFTHLAHNSLVNQTVNPKYMHHGFNLTGNGFVAWSHDNGRLSDPILYKSKILPFYDYNFEMQTKMIETDCFITHIRGGVLSTGVVLTTPNAHPFLFKDAPFALAHNGGLHNGTIEQQLQINAEMMKRTRAKWFSQIRGTTDSEHIYALLLTCFEEQKNNDIEHALPEAILQTLSIIQSIRKKFKVYYASPINLFISNGHFICAVRYTFDFGVFNAEMTRKHLTYYSLWYTYGESFQKIDDIYQMSPGSRSTICLASEPLSRDSSTWLEVPEYSLFLAKREAPLKVLIRDIDF